MLNPKCIESGDRKEDCGAAHCTQIYESGYACMYVGNVPNGN